MGLEAASFVNRKDLPDDIVYDILLKLPAKSLFRFRFVSKNWGNIIDSHSFCKKHATTEAAAAEEPQVLQVPFPLGLSKTLHSLSYDGNVIKESERPILEFSMEKRFVLKNGAYGLLWFQDMHGVGDAFLCNPLRGEVLELPRARIPTPNMGNVDTAVYGIGFDSTSKTYKIVRVVQRVITVAPNELTTEVYTLGTDSWREISSTVTRKHLQPDGVSAYEDMHWLAYSFFWRRPGESTLTLMSFDFKNEVFKENPLPNFEDNADLEDFRLIYLKGYLGFVRFACDTHVEIWLMKDYDKKVWAREHIISTQIWVREPDNRDVMRPDIGFRGENNRRFFTSSYHFSVGACGSQGLFFGDFNNFYKHSFVVDLKRNRLYMHSLRSEDDEDDDDEDEDDDDETVNLSSKFIASYTGSLLSLKHFGHSVDQGRLCNFLKTARRVYVAPPVPHSQ